MSRQNQKKPVHRVRLSTITASIFKNESDDGKTYYNTQIDRGYKVEDEWKNTKSFGFDDLLNVAKVVELAHGWIHQQPVEPATREPS